MWIYQFITYAIRGYVYCLGITRSRIIGMCNLRGFIPRYYKTLSPGAVITKITTTWVLVANYIICMKQGTEDSQNQGSQFTIFSVFRNQQCVLVVHIFPRAPNRLMGAYGQANKTLICHLVVANVPPSSAPASASAASAYRRRILLSINPRTTRLLFLIYVLTKECSSNTNGKKEEKTQQNMLFNHVTIYLGCAESILYKPACSYPSRRELSFK